MIPYVLHRWMLGTFTTQGDVVLDYFAGTGKLAKACLQLQRHCISVEMDEACYNVGIRPLDCPTNLGQ